MNLLSFRAPVLYAACHHCGNAMTSGDAECPHCGTNQSRALRTVGAPNSVAYGSNVLLMPGRMLVPYPSVPDELDTAMNIARERKRVLKRVAFYLASAGMLAMALGLAYAPALRSPVVQRLAALPEPATRKTAVAPIVPVAPEDHPDVAVAASSATVRDVTSAPQAVVAAVTPVTAAPQSVVAKPGSQPAVPAAVKQAAVEKPPTVAASVAPPAIVAPKTVAPPAVSIAQSQSQAETKAPAPAQAESSSGKAAGSHPAVSAMALSALAALEAQAHAFNGKFADTYSVLLAMAASAVHPAPVSVPAETPLANKAETSGAPGVSIPAPLPSEKPPAVAKAAPSAPAITTNITTLTPPATPAPDVPPAQAPAVALARPAPPVPSPSATADVPIASHAPEPSALTENGLPRMSATPISPAMTAERPPAGSPGETLYIARLALLTNDLGAARKNLAEVPSSMAGDVEAKRIGEELTQRESARDTAMQRARACEAASSWRCARRNAKQATTIDASYPDARVLVKRVNIKAAQAKKAADAAAALQAANSAAHPPVHMAPIREAVTAYPVPHIVAPGAAQPGTYVAAAAPSSQSSGNSAPHALPAPSPRATRDIRDTHVIHDARETRPIVETRESVVVPAPAKSQEPAEPESHVFGGGVPIRAPGRGEAH